MSAKPKRKTKWIVIGLLAAVLVCGVLLRPDAGAMYAETQVTTGDIRTTYSFTGSLAASRSQTVYASAAGKVKDLYVEANQAVEEGDRLLRMSTGEVVKAEMDGEIVSLNVKEGDPAAAGSVLLTVMDVENMEAVISVDEYDVDAIELGREVSVTVNALGVTSAGEVVSFDKQASSMGTMAAYSAKVRFEVPEKALPGMQVEVQMLNQSAEDTLLLSVDALQFDEKNEVYVMTKNADGEYVQTYVETGINDGSTVQILSGLQSGQTVYYAAGMDIMELMQAMRGRMR